MQLRRTTSFHHASLLHKVVHFFLHNNNTIKIMLLLFPQFLLKLHNKHKNFKTDDCVVTTVACRKGHQGIQSIPKILSSSSPCSHVSINKSVACIPRYFCYGPPLSYNNVKFTTMCN